MNPWIGALACLVFSLALAQLGHRRGWGDAPVGAESARKLQRAAVPAIGGFAIALAWLAQALFTGAEGNYGLSRGSSAPGCVAAALLVALVAGWADDARRNGLAPTQKLALQALAGSCLTLPLFLARDAAQGAEFVSGVPWSSTQSPLAVQAAWLVLLAVLAQNALNLFDNADGAATGVAGCGLLSVASPLAPAVLVFLIPNLFLRRRAQDESRERARDPWAYLGDAGSQLLGLALVVTPGAQGALLVPVLDMIRVALVRVRQGQRPWVGDRRHLAHRLQRRGLGPVAVVLALLLVAAPALVWPSLWGVLGTCALFGAACMLTREVEESGARA